jgi:glycerol-3-phosphate dehydrogenase
MDTRFCKSFGVTYFFINNSNRYTLFKIAPADKRPPLKTQVLIIGGGATGTGLARDLALRGVRCILCEKSDINAGASGANHGYLHSGARYVAKDAATAKECWEESLILKKVAPQCIEETGGLWVAVQGDDEKYAADFPQLCRRSGIPVQAVTPEEARRREPNLADKIIAAYAVPEAAVDPFRLSCENIQHAVELGTTLLRGNKVVGFKQKNKRIEAVHLLDTRSGKQAVVETELVVNAAGAWAGQVAALAGARINLVFSKGTLIITHHRLSQGIVMRLRPPSDGDALIPGGTVSIFGTSSVAIDSPDDCYPTVAEVDHIIGQGAALLPVLEQTRFIRAYAGVRPLIGLAGGDDRALSRDMALIDHSADGVDNFISITGGKLTTYRLMAEKTADLVCQRLGISIACVTRTAPLPSSPICRWTEPAFAPKQWLQQNDPWDLIMCECELVPQSVVNDIIGSIAGQADGPKLMTLLHHSRLGRGACQGTFCGIRALAHFYNMNSIVADEGLTDLKTFLQHRWKGQRPILWGAQLQQAEMEEALHCGLFGLELQPGESLV